MEEIKKLIEFIDWIEKTDPRNSMLKAAKEGLDILLAHYDACEYTAQRT